MTLRQSGNENLIPYYMIDCEDVDYYEEDPMIIRTKATRTVTGAAERKKILTKKLNADDCLKILVKYNNILNIKWQLC